MPSPRRLLAFAVVFLMMSIVGVPPLAHADAPGGTRGGWSGGAGVGFLANTPDGVEFALKGHADYFWAPRFSVGPLALYAGVGNDFVLGVSAQAKYWWEIPRTRRPVKLVVQGGIGFVRAGIEDSDSGITGTYSSFLIPVGVGADYAVSRTIAVTVDVLVNVTALGERARAGGRQVDLYTNVMPGLYLGIRF
jgi:hypothetical protein